MNLIVDQRGMQDIKGLFALYQADKIIMQIISDQIAL